MQFKLSCCGAQATLLVPWEAVAQGVCSTVLHTDLKRTLGTFLKPEQVAAVISSSAAIGNLSASNLVKVRQAYGASYNSQFQALSAFAGLASVAALCLGIIRNRLGDRMKAAISGERQSRLTDIWESTG